MNKSYDRVAFTLRLQEVSYAKLKRIAEQQKRSMNNMMEYLVDQVIFLYEKENGEITLTETDGEG